MNWKIAPLTFFLFLGMFFTSTPAAERVTLLLEHEESAPWTDLLRKGLNKAVKDFNIEAKVIIAPVNKNQTEIFCSAAENSDLVLVTGENLHEILRDNASRYRRVMFGSIDAGIRASNIMSVTFADQEAAFLAGVAAAMLTKQTQVNGINAQNTIGWLSGRDTLAMRTLFNGFEEGARLADPDIHIVQGLVKSFTDPVLAGEKTENLLNAGADVIVLAAGAGNSGAKANLDKAGAWQIDLDAPMDNARTLATIAKAADTAVYEIINAFHSGKYGRKEILVFDLKNGGVSLEGLPEFAKKAGSKVASPIQRRIEELKNEFARGTISLRSFRARTLCDCLD